MGAVDTVSGLAQFGIRAAGSESERRAAKWLAAELESGRRRAEIETFWCRPNTALAQAWHVALGLAGSLVSVAQPRVGGALLLAAIVFVIADALMGWSPGRRLTFEHASQNVVSVAGGDDRRTRLILTAGYDAGRTGLVYRPPMRRLSRSLRRLTADRGPGWAAWIVLLLAWVLATAVLRLQDADRTLVGALQLLPTVALVLALALMLELASSAYGPAAGDNGSGVGVALALVRALDVSPPRNLAVELVLTGAAEGGGIGLRRHLRARRRAISSANTVVLGLGPCGAGTARWWLGDGSLLPLRYHERLRALCARAASEDPNLEARPSRGRGTGPAYPARLAGLPAINLGSLDSHDLPPRSHTAEDTVEHLERRSLDSTLELALLVVEMLDAEVARGAQR